MAIQKLAALSPTYSVAETFAWCLDTILVEQRETGRMSGEDFYRAACRELSLPTQLTYEKFTEMWGDIFLPAPQRLVEVLQAIPNDIQRCVTSNTEEIHWPYMARLDTTQQFNRENDFIVRSFDAGVRKPQVAFFEYALHTVNEEPQHVLFIDDVSAFVDVFRTVGGRSAQFDLRADAPDMLRHILEEQGIL